MTDDDKTIRTPVGRILWPHLENPDTRFSKDEAAAKYNVTLIVRKDDPALAPFKARIKKVIAEKWGADRSAADLKSIPLKPVTAVFKNKTAGLLEKFPAAEYAVIRGASKFKPTNILKFGPGEALVEVADISKDIYSGCHGTLGGVLETYSGSAIGEGVTFYVNMVLKTGEGARIGGGDPTQVFAGVRPLTSDEDPTEGMEAADDEIPL